MRVPNTEHQAHHWRIDEVAGDFELEDVWRLPVTGSDKQFPELLSLAFLDGDAKGTRGVARLAKWLLKLRIVLGRAFGWDRDVNVLPIPGSHETSLRDRLHESERAAPELRSDSVLPFRLVYRDNREAFFELSNRTLHAIMQYSWVPEGDHFRGRLAVYVKTRDWFGSVYLAAIAPFRRFIIYPTIIQQIGARWRESPYKGETLQTER